MKKIIRVFAVIIAIVCSVSLLAACNSGNDNKDDGKNDGKNDGAVAYYVNYNGTKIELGKKADSVLSALGTPKAKDSLGDCGGFGLQTRYTYNDIVVYTVKNDSGETIDQITFSNDTPETPKGICIGDSSESVISAYGEPTAKNDTKIEYQKDSLVLKFGIENGEVKSINFIRITSK